LQWLYVKKDGSDTHESEAQQDVWLLFTILCFVSFFLYAYHYFWW